ncbi:MAG: sugar transferase [Fimbriimonadaceae bacterium]|nr:sugar transferase [Fimbriimonadaceae bacterium]
MLPAPEAADRRAYRLTKRLLDVLLGTLALALLLPWMLVFGLLIVLDSPGAPLFVQPRVGLHGRRIRVLKLRTMSHDAESRLAALRATVGASGPVFKLRDDPRVTRVGRWLRRSSLDEAPQLLNVLRGDMSLVGPRPLPPDQTDPADPRFAQRVSVPPGLTGQWQITGRVMHVNYDKWLAQDCWYVEHCSLGLDLVILARTLPAVIRGEGAY